MIGRSGLSQLSDYWAAEALITAIDANTGECQLSKPLPKDLKAESPVPMATLKYLPLHPVGTQEYDETASGWVKYASIICQLVKEAGIDDFDLPSPVQLTLQYGAIGQPREIFKGDERHPPLRYEDVFAFLPFQVSSRKLVIAVYVMTHDITKPMQEQQYRLAIRGLPAGTTPRTLYDPITGKSSSLQVTREGDAVEVTVPVVDYPRMMVVESL